MAGNDNDDKRHDEAVPRSTAETNDTNPAEDPILSRSLDNLTHLEVPPVFLPHVMSRVFEKYSRAMIKPPAVLGYSALLLLLCGGFFVWDVLDFQSERGLDSFQAAFSLKSKLILANFDNLTAAFAGMFSTTWQLLGGASASLIGRTPWPVGLLVLAVVAGLAYWLFRGLRGRTAR